MKIKLYIFIILTISFIGGFAQQMTQNTLYMLNDYVYNPAVAGSRKYTEVNLDYRAQWVGLDGAPKTYLVSIDGPVGPKAGTKNVGLGGYIVGDQIGALTRTAGYASYAYHLTLKKLEDDELRLSMALAGGISQLSVDKNKITTLDLNDPALNYVIQSVVLPDAVFGAYLYTKKYYFGAAIHQLIRPKLKIFNIDGSTDGRLNYHYYITGGYKFKLGESFELEPSMMLKQTINLPTELDFNAKLTYKETVWMGATYRSYDALAIMFGYNYQNHWMFAYAYDFTTSNIRTYSYGSHELLLSYRFGAAVYRAMVN